MHMLKPAEKKNTPQTWFGTYLPGSSRTLQVLWGFCAEKPAVNFFVGDFQAEALQIAETGRGVAIYQFGGTTNTDQLPFFMTTCDQTLIGEELYTAQGYLTSDPEAISRLIGPDAGKILAILLILAGALLITFGNSILIALMEL